MAMKEKRVWILAIFLVPGVLLLSTCAAVEKSPVSTITYVPNDKTTTQATPLDLPHYGGILTCSAGSDLGVFDWVSQGQTGGPVQWMVIESRLAEDWSRGASGTGELKWFDTTTIIPDTCVSALAASWEIPEPGTYIFKIRRGVHFALNPKNEASRLMNGREVTVNDWVYSFNYSIQNPRSGIKNAFPQLAATAMMEVTGPEEVTLKTPVEPLLGWLWLAPGSIFPTEVIQKYGDMHEWQNVVGTGPFMLTDYVENSSATLVRNNNYWDVDPVGLGKGNQLPYLNGLKMLVISDISTLASAFRTGKIDYLTNIIDADSLHQLQTGQLSDNKYATYLLAHPIVVMMRTDKEDLPYKNVKVRQALMLATDYKSLKDEFYGGEADILGFPVTREAGQAYMPLEEMPESTQSLFRYDPEKARHLLAEANYPDGIKAKIAFTTDFDMSDLASALKAMWAKADIELELQAKEPGTFASMAYSRSYDEMMLSFFPSGASYPLCLNLNPFRGWNISYVHDQVIDATYEEIQNNLFVDMPKANQLFREKLPYIVEQVYYVPIPSGHTFSVWWPWLKNYHGETPISLAKYWWIDQNLKEEIIGRR
jgi:peptide/nickel transport system substrate-binding protein